jgi:HJR/Mrr/RecB family endonuclease
LQDVDLSGVAVPSVNFQGANIKGVRFDSANLEGCDFFRASIKLSSFQGASLVGVRFDEALIEESHFEKALLDGASFVGTRIVETNLSTDQGRILPLDRDPLEWTLQDRFSIDLMNPWEFERFVGTLFTITGFQVYGRPEGPDEGFDFVATKDDPIKGKEIYLVECKKYRPDRLVNISPLRALLAKRGEKNADHVVLVSSSGFTDSVRQLASEIPGVDLLDRHALQQLVVKALNRRPENHM